jgi:hypothetical protein
MRSALVSNRIEGRIGGDIPLVQQHQYTIKLEVIVHVLYVRAAGINKAFRAERPPRSTLHSTRHLPAGSICSSPLLLTLINLSNRMHSLIASSSIHLSSPLTTYTSSSSQKHLASSFLLGSSLLGARRQRTAV